MWMLRHGPIEWGWSEPVGEWKWFLKDRARKDGYFTPTNRFMLELPLDVFGDTVEEALEEARACVAEGGLTLSGMPAAELHLAKVEAAFDQTGNVREGLSQLVFEGTLAEVPAFPVAFDGPQDTFFGALRAATTAAKGQAFIADAIQETPAYWFFPALVVDCLGALFDRKTGRAVPFGSAFPLALWIWGYERGLVDADYTSGDLVITEIRDRERAANVLARFNVSSPADLPIVVRGAATWMDIQVLHDAGDALEWRVERSHAE